MTNEGEKAEIPFSDDDDDEAEVSDLGVEQGQRRVYSQTSDPTIDGLYRRFQKGRLALQPEFQRGYVWDNTKASRLIESVLLDVPIPNLYLAEENDATESVIDGQQRLTSFFRVFQPIPLKGGREAPQLHLTSLRVLTDLNGKSFDYWGQTHQTRFENASMRIVTIKKESDPDVKYEIFERLNNGSMGLNDQELRNCVYRGPYNALLHELADDQDFQKALGWKEPDRRMRDLELVLRAFAFRRVTHLNYRSPMKGFLNREMREHRYLSPSDVAEQRAKFKDAITLAYSVFGERAFRRFVPGNDRNANGQWEKTINRGLYDVVMFGFFQYPKNQVMRCADAIREELLWLMSSDQEFVDSTMLSTSGVPRVRTRFEKWLSSLNEILGHPSEERRSFSASDKETLYHAPGGDTCAWEHCGQKILSIDDAEVDHVEHYWRGGRTELANGRLLHRYCNRKRGGRQ